MSEKVESAFNSKFVLKRFPENDEELYWFTQAMWGVRIPRYSVCPNHVAPFTAFANAYFAREPLAIWKASRGFGGKTQTLSCLVTTEAVCLAADSSILGGSAAQSLNVHASSTSMWHHATAPKYLLAQDPTKYDTYLTNGSHIRSLMASQTSVRGPHPQRLRLDEIDEMELEILNAAQGQPMRKAKNGKIVETQTVMSSTHQYPDKTMSAMIARSREQGWPLYEWCWRESSNPRDGWLTTDEVMRQKSVIPKAMWDAEYDLQEPSFEGRAFDVQAIETAFDPTEQVDTLRWRRDNHVALRPDMIVTSVDWAKQRDLTVVLTFDAANDPWKLIECRVFNRLPWPVTVNEAEKQYKAHGGHFIHDSTGLGNVVSDYFDETLKRSARFEDYIMGAGRTRMDLFSEYISAIEAGAISYPRIEQIYREHKYCTLEDLYGKGHPPDSVVAGALAWHRRKMMYRTGFLPPVGIDRGSSPWQLDEAQAVY